MNDHHTPIRECIETFALSIIIEGVTMFAVLVTALIWCAIGAGRI